MPSRFVAFPIVQLQNYERSNFTNQSARKRQPVLFGSFYVQFYEIGLGEGPIQIQLIETESWYSNRFYLRLRI
jgi:hypothetical protein